MKPIDVKLTLRVKSEAGAFALTGALIEFERTLDDQNPNRPLRTWNMDKVAIARRRLQEDAGLVMKVWP